jgi:hypothetical protein
LGRQRKVEYAALARHWTGRWAGATQESYPRSCARCCACDSYRAKKPPPSARIHSSLRTGKRTTARFLARYGRVLSLAGPQARTECQHDRGKADTIQMPVI